MSDDDSVPFDVSHAEALAEAKMMKKFLPPRQGFEGHLPIKEIAEGAAKALMAVEWMRESRRVGNELKAISQQIDEEEKRVQEKEKIKKEMDEFIESSGRRLKEMEKKRADVQKRLAEIQDELDALDDVRE